MNKLDLFEMGLRNLWRRKLRTFLTILGVIIGTSSIVVMLSLGIGMSQSLKSQIESMGSLTTITVTNNEYDDMAMMGGIRDNKKKKKAVLDSTALATFKNMPHIKGVTPIIELQGAVINGKYVSNVPIKGIMPETMEYFDFTIEEGRLLQTGDDFAMVFGGGVKNSFSNPKNYNDNMAKDFNLMTDKMQLTLDDTYGMPVDQGMKKPNYKKYKIKTAGVLEESSGEHDWSIFMPFKTVEKLLKEKQSLNKDNNRREPKKKGYDSVWLKVDGVNYVKDIQDQVKDMGFSAFSLTDLLEGTKKMSGTIQAVLGGIGAVSLIVAAIGITNTMIMSIYERTKEIGVMKVIGASLKDIKQLFLFESAIIGFLGGILGVIFSIIISYAINKISMGLGAEMGVTGNISVIPIPLALLSIGFSTLIGILSGYYPAKRAMNLSALEAIKTE